ncbi:MAG: glycosyl hydrolase 2 galactose-binding domain-containing protein, partial [Limisphaerales bacterium]
ISQPGYSVAGWYPITVPSTVMAGLVTNNVYTNLFFGTNLQSVADLTKQNWWYRGQFLAPANSGGQYWLRFKGIAYRAKIWLNGTQLDANAVGSMVNHEYNVTSLLNNGGSNALAILVTPPSSAGTNLSFWYADWNPKPPDWNAGLWGKVLLDATGPVALRDPYVKTVLPLPATNSAKLTVYVDAANGSSNSVSGVLSGVITKSGYPSISFSQNVTLNPNERREIVFDPMVFTQLQVTNPALWWPIPLGSPELYNLQLTFSVGGTATDSASVDFGIRQFTDYLTASEYGSTYKGYKVNGQNVLLRGAAYVWDMFMRWDTNINQTHANYARDMGLNVVRFEGILGNDDFYADADRAGVMLMPGFVCCTYWASWSSWSAEDLSVANASLNSQMRLMRAHPSALVWAYGSDELPTPSVLAGYKSIATSLHWQNPTLDNVASYNNSSGNVPKMNGPYTWEPPVYWYADTNLGGAFGICVEQGSEVVPPEESLRKFIAPADLWPIGSVYGYHAGAGVFAGLSFYTPGVTSRYGAVTGITQYAQRAQMLNYETQRAQFEAFGANAYSLAQGTVFWMMNNAWPSVHWNLYDYFFKPGGAYFGTKKALEPVHILYDYKTANIKVFNATLAAVTNATASVAVYNVPGLALNYSNSVTMDFPANASTTALNISGLSGLTMTYLIRLRLADAGGRAVSENVYAYSTAPDKLGTSTNWYHTSISAYANLTGLNSFSSNTNLNAYASRQTAGGQETVTFFLTNSSASNIAYCVRAEITQGDGGLEVLPILYSDNYITIWPGDSKTITATYATSALGGLTPSMRVSGFNVPSLIGTCAVAAATQLTIQMNADGSVMLGWNSDATKGYQPEYSDELTNGWSALGLPMPGTGSNNTFVDTNAVNAEKIYRVRELPR